MRLFSLHTRRALVAWSCLLLSGSLLLSGCSKKVRETRGRLDTPEHHARRGADALETRDWAGAERSFSLALDLSPEHVPALAGKAVALAGRADGLASSSEARRLNERAFALLDDADDAADSEGLKFQVYAQGIQVHRLSRQPADRWLRKAEIFYEKAERIAPPGSVVHHLYAGRAYRDAFELPKSETAYRLVLSSSTPLGQTAEQELAVVQKVRRAAPGALHGKKVAFLPSLSRADVAALFLEELRLARLYRLRQAPPQGAAPVARDIQAHPLRGDIEAVLELGIRGLELDTADRFQPDALITRAEFAVMVEDILSVITGEKNLKTRFFGQTSPFSDVRGDAPHYNAVQTVVSRGLMEPLHKLSGRFGPKEPLQGVEALLVIRLIKDELRGLSRS